MKPYLIGVGIGLLLVNVIYINLYYWERAENKWKKRM